MNERYKILPLWIKIFSWIFLISILSPAAFIAGYFVGDIKFDLFGLAYKGSAFQPISICLIFLLTFHGVVALGLILGKRWGVDAGIVCGIIGGLCSIAGMIIKHVQGVMHFEFSLPLQVFFIISLSGIRQKWISSEKKSESISNRVD